MSHESAAGASTSWSSYLRTCIPVLVNQWTNDYSKLESALGTAKVSTITNAVNVFGRLGAKELGSCTDSPDRTLNSEVQSLTPNQGAGLALHTARWQNSEGVRYSKTTRSSRARDRRAALE